jgi:5-methylcytosine-specific restriction endonuclease McrA
MKHGHLTVVREVEQSSRGHVRFECVCACGKVVAIRASHFTQTRQYCSSQCPIYQRQKVKDLTGKRFGRWTVMSAGRVAKSSWWNCRCDCGTEKALRGVMLSAGQSKSCGCLIVDMLSKNRTPEEALAAKREVSARSARKHAARVKAAKIRYESKLARATPAWLTADDWKEMDALYEEARRLTRETGIRHEVDHIHPINGKTVSGLHVPKNLQILTQAANAAKSNRYAELSGD